MTSIWDDFNLIESESKTLAKCSIYRKLQSDIACRMKDLYKKCGREDVDQLELMCKQLYETADTNVRNEAEKALIQFAESSDCLSKCQQLLERGSSPYAQLLAATTLTKVISRNGTLIPILERVDIRHYILNYFATRPKLEPYVQQALMLLFCRLTKLGWFDSTDDKNTWPFRNILDTVGRFLQSGDSSLVLIGVQLLSNLVLEMNQISEAEANRSLMKHRKIAFSFRDQHLYDIFRIGCSLLKNAASNIKNFNPNNESEHGLVMHSLRLVQNCLTFDFIGTANDESADDLGTVQIPTGWRNAFREDETVQLFFDLYVGLPPTLAAMALSCLVQIASIRRSLFNNTERAKFLNCLVQGVKSILQSPQGLSEAEAYHEFCRLVARLKSNYQLGELVKVDNYPEFIKLVAEFTVKSLQSWHCGPNSVHYLLSLWQRMVASVPYVKATEPHLLERFIPQITTAYITSRLEAVPIIIRDGLEDPLDDPSALLQQLDQLSTIGRCEYEKTCGLLVQLFDQSAHRYQELLSYYDSARSSGNDADLAASESRLTWLVFIIGAVIGGRVSFSSTDEHDAMDGELVCRVLQLMRLTDQRLASQQGYASPKLELAFLAFFEHFRKIYIGDNVQKTSKVYRRLAEVLGLNDETMVLSVYIQKIVTNLKYWGGNESIISRTLTLLSELSVGYSSVRKLVKLDTVQFVLSNHTSDHFPFLSLSYSGEPAVNGLSGRDSNSSNSTPRGLAHMKYRTTFYTALGRLLMVDLGEDEERFAAFVTPLTSAFDGLAALMSGSPGAVLTSPDHAKLALVGLARDLRGIAYSLNSKASYALLFDWLYPIYSDLMIRATVDTWYAEPGVTTPVLKLFAEIAQNRSNRLQFDVSSPNGFLLFKEVSKLLVGYGSRLLNLGDNIPKSQLYAMKLKGISICFAMLKAVLCGNYVNFGVFSLYGDDTLDKALEMFVSLLLSISQADLLQYPKLSQTYYTLLECLAQDHVVFLAQLDPSVFLYILSTISEGLTALDTMVCAGCCATLDNILTFIFKLVQRKNKPGGGSSHSRQKLSSGGPGCPGAVGLEVLAALARRQALAENNMIQVLDLQPQVFQQMLSTVLNIIMFEDCRNQWSMSRPLLPLILLNEKYFTELRQSITSNQPVDRQEMMAACFDKLMDGIERSLLIKNRDKFTQNLSVFRRDVNDSVKSSSNASNSAGGGGGSSPPSVAFGVSGGGQQQHTETMMLT